ncbi:EAL domain-containing protein [Neiella sp. HB171785]|uniref:EAL domain-containing protein n=2 Tax=Neiella litorisoli TaxID=2771431 RepID=A0A8J6UDR8_9GAMM|nr:EAL domain-containing protein [Neiella litorisoli]
MTRSKVSVWMIYIAPVILVTLAVAILGVLNVRHTVQALAEGYAQAYNRIVANVAIENESALLQPDNCDYLQQALRYEREIYQLQTIADGQILCSSLDHADRRAIIDIEKLDERPQRVELALMPMSQDISVAVVNRRVVDGKVYYAASLVDLDYMRANLGYRTEQRAKSAALFVGDDVAPPNAVRTHGWFVYTALAGVDDNEIQVIASDELIEEKAWFCLFAAIVCSLITSLAIVIARRFLFSHRGIHGEVKSAIKRKEFILHFQLQVDARTGKVVGVEALVRWLHPERGLIYPDVFIPVLEEFGLMTELTELVVEQAAAEFADWTFTERFHLGINFPPDYFLSDKHGQGLISQAKLLKSRGIQLGLEITERQLLDQRAKAAITDLREFGLEVLIDDFGTGQTSLAMLESTPIDYLKIDKCFVDTIGSDSVNTPVLDAIIAMAHGLNLNLIAEGVEHRSQAEYLLARDVTLHQGYLYSKPKPLEQLSQLRQGQA